MRDQGAAHILDEIIVARARQRAIGNGLKRPGGRRSAFGFGDEIIGRHLAQHIIAPAQRAFTATNGIISGRRLGQYGHERHLRQIEPIHRFAEIGLGSGFHPIGVAAKEDLVEVDFQDLLLRQRGFQPASQDRFPDLAP